MPGLPRSIIKKYGVTKKAWEVFRSGRHRRVSSPSKVTGRRRISMPRRRRRYAMAGRRPRRSFRSRLAGKRFPLSFAPAIVVPIGSMLFGDPNGQTGGIVQYAQSGGLEGAAHEAMNVIPYELIGYRAWGTPNFDWGIWARNIALILGGWGMHTLANKTGLNRQMAKVPLLGKYVSI